MNKESNPRTYHLMRGLLAVMTLLMLAVLAGYSARVEVIVCGEPPKNEIPEKTASFNSFPAASIEALVRTLEGAWGVSKSPEQVPNVAPAMLPAGLERMDLGEKKITFVRAILPHVLDVNRRILAEREVLQQISGRIRKGLPLRQAEAAYVREMAVRYRTPEDTLARLATRPAGVVDELLRRVDVIPPSLVLAQAALESAWGASRFVLEGNNLFGQLIFTVEKGMAPAGLTQGTPFALARFETLTDAVEAYARNLNSLGAYRGFRELRADMRAKDGLMDSDRLAEGLTSYSERGESYVEDVKSLIRYNRFKKYDASRLVDVKPRKEEPRSQEKESKDRIPG